MRKPLRIVLIGALMILIAIQFIRPPRNNGGYETLMAFEKETSPSVQVATILKENCYDCHSAQTQYPWYAEIAPISYWLSGHIDHGKSSFNVSVWNSYSTKKKDQQLEALIEQIQAGEMPLESYTWIHGKLSEDQKMALLQWVGLARLRYKNALQVSANEPL